MCCSDCHEQHHCDAIEQVKHRHSHALGQTVVHGGELHCGNADATQDCACLRENAGEELHLLEQHAIAPHSARALCIEQHMAWPIECMMITRDQDGIP